MAGLASAAADMAYLFGRLVFGRLVGDLLLGWRSGEGSRPRPSALLCEHEDTPPPAARRRFGTRAAEWSGHRGRGRHSLRMLTSQDYNVGQAKLPRRYYNRQVHLHGECIYRGLERCVWEDNRS